MVLKKKKVVTGCLINKLQSIAMLNYLLRRFGEKIMDEACFSLSMRGAG